MEDRPCTEVLLGMRKKGTEVEDDDETSETGATQTDDDSLQFYDSDYEDDTEFYDAL